MLNIPRQFMSALFGTLLGFCLIFFSNLSLKNSYEENTDSTSISQFPLINETDWNENELNANDIDFDIVSYEEREDDMYNKVRILCWILTAPANHEEKAKVVKETWGSRCNILLFMSSESDPTLPTVKLPVYEGRNQLWGKTREAYRYVWNNYRDKADWFLKADDDSFVILENLRYFLSGFDTSQPMWFGHKFKVIVDPEGYFSGGAGYVLSKEAVRRFIEIGYFDGVNCRHDHDGAEDAEMGACMAYLNVKAMDTRDSKRRGRFFPFVPADHYFSGDVTEGYWYWDNIYYPPTKGKDCCSDSTISFHYVDPNMMRSLFYLIYQLRVFGRESDRRPSTPEPPPDLYLNETRWFAPTTTSTTTTTTTTPPPTTTTTTTTPPLTTTTPPLTTTTPTTTPPTTTTPTTTPPTPPPPTTTTTTTPPPTTPTTPTTTTPTPPPTTTTTTTPPPTTPTTTTPLPPPTTTTTRKITTTLSSTMIFLSKNVINPVVNESTTAHYNNTTPMNATVGKIPAKSSVNTSNKTVT